MFLLPVAIFVLFINIAASADPVYAPATISDNSSNFADSNSTITWGSLPEGITYSAGTPSRISEGLSTYYTMTNGFVSTVFSQGIPDGKD